MTSKTYLSALLVAGLLSAMPLFKVVCTANVDSCPSGCECTLLADSTIETDCQRRALTSIPKNVSTRTSRLLLQANKIVKLTSESFRSNLSQLTDLYLNGNGLEQLDNNTFYGLVSLKRLYLSQNRLRAFPQVCQFSPQLQRLLIDNNAIDGQAFPDSYTACSQLTTVSVSGNRWTKLSRSIFASLKNSKDLSSLKITSVGLQVAENSTLADLSQTLRSLDLSQNSISEQNLMGLFQTTKFSNRFISLSLRGSSGLTRLPVGLLPAGHFPRLGVLDISDCSQLSKIDDGALAGSASYLTDLLLNGASITQLSDRTLFGLDRLRRLSMASTALTGWSGSLPLQLAQLDVSSSKLTTIGGSDGVSINPLLSLVHFNVSKGFEQLKAAGNPFRCDCNLAWLRIALQDSRVRARIPDLTRWVCAEPSQLAGYPVVNFTLPDDCAAKSTTISSPVSSDSHESSVKTSSFSSTVSQSEYSGDPTSVTASASQSDSSTVSTSISSPDSQSDSSTVSTSIPSPASQSEWILPVACTVGGLILLLLLLSSLVVWVRRRGQCRFISLESRKDSAASQTTLDSEMIEA